MSRIVRPETTTDLEAIRERLQREKRRYLKQNPQAKRFKLHNFRGKAMTRAKEAGVSYEDAAVAFGCNPETMRKHYVALDEISVLDWVMKAIRGRGVKWENQEPPKEIDAIAGTTHTSIGWSPPPEV